MAYQARLGVHVHQYRGVFSQEGLKGLYTRWHVGGTEQPFSQMRGDKTTGHLTDDEVQRIYDATQVTLVEFADNLRAEVGDGFPEKVTAFRADMAVHGKYGEPCPVCGSPVQRIVYASNETNYCATCQTGGKLLADRSLSRLLKDDWSATIEDLEER